MWDYWALEGHFAPARLMNGDMSPAIQKVIVFGLYPFNFLDVFLGYYAESLKNIVH